MIIMYEITSSSSITIDYAATGDAAILQSATFLLATFAGTCPLHREFGWDPPLDDPSEFAKASMSAQIIERLEREIPEITVKDVTFEQGKGEGHYIARVKVEIKHD
jgi:phage baseplate assembly protein W